MTTPAEITVTMCFAVAIAIGTMFVMPRPKPEPPAPPAPEEQPVNQAASAEAKPSEDLVTQSTGENVPIEGQTDRLKLLEQRLLAIDAQVKRIEVKADEQASKRRN